MSATAAEAIAALDEHVLSLENLADFHSIDTRKRLIEFRRTLPAFLLTLETKVTLDLEAMGGSSSITEFRSKLSNLRHAISLHQGAWPAAIIDADTDGYAASLRSVISTYRTFISWLRKEMAMQSN